MRKVTQEELDTIAHQLSKDKYKRDILRDYQIEADPLFFKWQAGEVLKEEWLAKRIEIKKRYSND